MPYDSVSELPGPLKDALPKRAQEIFMEAYNNALENNAENPSAVAWEAVKNAYEKNEEGEWVRKYVVKSSDEELKYTLGIVYEPYKKDAHDHYMEPETIREACWDYAKKIQKEDDVTKLAKDVLSEIVKAVEEDKEISLDITKMDTEGIQKSLKDMHKDEAEDSYIVENYIAPADFEIGDKKVKKGSWLLGVRWSDEMYEKISKGERTGYSLGGKATLIDTD